MLFRSSIFELLALLAFVILFGGCEIKRDDERTTVPLDSLPKEEQNGGNESAALVYQQPFEGKENLEAIKVKNENQFQLTIKGKWWLEEGDNPKTEEMTISLNVTLPFTYQNFGDIEKLEGQKFDFAKDKHEASIKRTSACKAEIGEIHFKRVDTISRKVIGNWQEKETGLIISGEFEFGGREIISCHVEKGWFDYTIKQENFQ